MTTSVGLEHLIANPPGFVRGKRLGLLTNPNGVTRSLANGIDLLAGHPALDLVALFGPEHGVRGEAQAGEHVGTAVDSRTCLPQHSLYGATRRPTPEMLSGIDVMLVDLQDIGVRHTTYLSSLAKVMEACEAQSIEVVILDRPNPLGGERISGNVLEPEHISFVGIHPIPTIHGLTMGEFGRLYARDHRLPTPHVIAMTGWKPGHTFDGTGQPWIMPSPNLPTLDSVRTYAATCLFEATNLSEGRGTTRPFECFGAPWIDSYDLAGTLNALELPGVTFRPIYFTPTFSKHQGVRCGGVFLHLTDTAAFDDVATGLHLIDAVFELYPDQTAWHEPTNGRWFIDLLTGTSAVRLAINADSPSAAVLPEWKRQAASFSDTVRDVLLYERSAR